MGLVEAEKVELAEVSIACLKHKIVLKELLCVNNPKNGSLDKRPIPLAQILLTSLQLMTFSFKDCTKSQSRTRT